MTTTASKDGRTPTQLITKQIAELADWRGNMMNSLPKYVVSTTLEKAEWNNSTISLTNITF